MPAGVSATLLDLAEPATFAPALAGITDVFLYAEPAGIGKFVDAAASARVRRVVLLSSDSVALPGAEHNALARHHLQVETTMRAASITSTVLRPGGFATMTLGWAEAIRAGRPVEQIYPEAKVDVIHAEDIVDVDESALTTDALDGETIALGGPERLTFRDQAEILGRGLGREIEMREPTRTQAVQHLRAQVSEPFVEAVLDYWAHLVSERPEATSSVQRITGRPGRSFRQWVTENLAAFQ